MTTVMDTGRFVDALSFNGPYYKTVTAFIQAESDRVARERVAMARVAIPYQIKGEQMARLQREFAWEIELKGTRLALAPFLAAKLFCCNKRLQELKAWEGEEVLYVDVSLNDLAIRKCTYAHVCRSFSAPDREAEYVQDDLALRKSASSKDAAVASIARKYANATKAARSQLVCTSARDCKAQVDTIVLDSSRVVLPPQQAATMCYVHGAQRVKTFFFFETAMFVSDHGALTSFSGSFKVDRDTRRVYIIPDNSNMTTIVYDLDILLWYMTHSHVVVDNREYSIERVDNIPGTVFLIMSRLDRSFTDVSKVVFDHWDLDQAKYLRYKHRLLLPSFHEYAGEEAVVTGVIPKSIHTKVLHRLLAIADDKLTVQAAEIAIADYAFQRIVSGTLVSTAVSVEISQSRSYALAVWKLAMIEKLRMREELRVLIENNVLNQDKFRTLVNCIFNKIRMRYDSFATVLKAIPQALMFGEESVPDVLVEIEAIPDVMMFEEIVRPGDETTYFKRKFSPSFPGGGVNVERPPRFSRDLFFARAKFFTAAESLKTESAKRDEFVVEVKANPPPIEGQKQELLDKMQLAFDPVLTDVGTRTLVKCDPEPQPIMSEAPLSTDPVVDINDVLKEIYPKSVQQDFEFRPHLAAEDSPQIDVSVPRLKINELKIGIAPQQKVRTSRINGGLGGKRPMNQRELLASLAKRVCNAPQNQGFRNYEQRLSEDFELFAEAVFRPGWRDVVKQRKLRGAGSPRLAALRSYVGHKLNSAKVASMLKEDFTTGNIDMTRWKLLVKTQGKPKMEDSVANTLTPTQTIIFQESKMTNTLFSSVLLEVQDIIDEILRPNVLINLRRDYKDTEEWFNSLKGYRDRAGKVERYESDISQCDKSQVLYNLMLFLRVAEELGVDPEIVDLWGVMNGRVTATGAQVGVMIEYVEQVKSGAFNTIFVNSITVAIATIRAFEIGSENIVAMMVSGDDVALELAHKTVDTSRVSEIYQDVYNFEAKTFPASDLYFCSRYFVDVDGYWKFVRDPLKAAESLGKALRGGDDMDEQFIAFQDNLKGYEFIEVQEALASAVQRRMELKVGILPMIRALSTLAQNKEAYKSVFNEVTYVGG